MKLKFSPSSPNAFELTEDKPQVTSLRLFRFLWESRGTSPSPLVPWVYECSHGLALYSPCRKSERGCGCLGEFFSFLVIKEQFCKDKSRCGTRKVSINYMFSKKFQKTLYKHALNRKINLFSINLYPLTAQNPWHLKDQWENETQKLPVQCFSGSNVFIWFILELIFPFEIFTLI